MTYFTYSNCAIFHRHDSLMSSLRQRVHCKIFHTFHCAALDQHAAPVSPWRPLRILKIYYPIAQCDLQSTKPTCVALTTTAHMKIFYPIPLCDLHPACRTRNDLTSGALSFNFLFLHYLIVLKRTNMLHFCRSENRALSWHLLHYFIVRIIKTFRTRIARTTTAYMKYFYPIPHYDQHPTCWTRVAIKSRALSYNFYTILLCY